MATLCLWSSLMFGKFLAILFLLFSCRPVKVELPDWDKGEVLNNEAVFPLDCRQHQVLLVRETMENLSKLQRIAHLESFARYGADTTSAQIQDLDFQPPQLEPIMQKSLVQLNSRLYDLSVELQRRGFRTLVIDQPKLNEFNPSDYAYQIRLRLISNRHPTDNERPWHVSGYFQVFDRRSGVGAKGFFY